MNFGDHEFVASYVCRAFSSVGLLSFSGFRLSLTKWVSSSKCFHEIGMLRSTRCTGQPSKRQVSQLLFFAAHLFTYSVFSPRLRQKLYKNGVASLTVTVQSRGWYCVRVRVPDLFVFCLYALCLSTQTFQRKLWTFSTQHFAA